MECAMNKRVLKGEVVSDVLNLLSTEFTDLDFIEGLRLAEELRHLSDRSYAVRSALSVAQLVSRSLLPVKARQVRFGKKVVRVYSTKDIRMQWEKALTT